MRRWGLIAAASAALALGACGDDDKGEDGGGDEPAKPAAARCTPAPEGTKELAVDPKFKAGDRRAVAIEKTREDSRQPEPLRATGESDLRVLSGGPKRATLRYETDEVTLPLPQNADREAIERIKEVTEEIPIEYATDAEGTLDELRNVAEVRAAMNRMFDEFEEIDPRLAEIAKLSRGILQSEEAIKATMTGDVATLHGAYGFELREGRPFKTPYELPNPLGGGPIAAEASFELKTLRGPDGCAVIESVIEPDVEALKEMLRDLAGRVGGPEPTEADLEGYRLRNTVTFKYDPGSGWVVHADAKREISLQDVRRTDRTVLTNAPAG
jgi:hypothetical protein